MTLSRITATGRGRLSARLVIEGWEYEYVSAKRMERTTSDGRSRVNGLDLADMAIGTSVDLMRAKLTGTSLTARIKDLDRVAGKRHGRVTRSLWRSPTVRLYLGANLAWGGTSLTLGGSSGAQLPSSGVVHIGTEAIEYATNVAGVLGGLTRGLWQSVAQSHYIADGEGLADALITDQPLGVEGRRVFLYLYGDGDDPQGDGTLRWRGVCATDVRWNGGTCEIELDPITRMLDQPIGGDLASPVQIRGIHYTSASPWGMEITNFDTGELPVQVRLTGFWETQEEFCTDANTAITNAIAAATFTIGDGAVFLTPEVGGYRVTYRADSTAGQRIYAALQSQIDARADGSPFLGWRGLPVGSADWNPATESTESFLVVAPVPRGSFGSMGGWAELDVGTADLSPTDNWKQIYLGGLVVPQEGDALFMTKEDAWPLTVANVDTTLRRVTITGVESGRFTKLDPNTSLGLGRRLAVGNFTDVIDSVVASSRTLANTGAMPLITDEFATWGTDVDARVAASTLSNGRYFYIKEGGVTLGEILTPEMIACGVYPALNSSGSIILRTLSPPLAGATADVVLDDSAAFGAMIEKSPRGVLSQVLYRVGYDPSSEEWAEETLTFRDVQSTSATRVPVTLEVAQRSTSVSTWRGSDTGLLGVDRSAVARVAIQYLGLFGTPTAVVTIQADARYMGTLVGDTVSLSSAILPDVEDGVSVMADRPGLVIATSVDLSSGRVSLGIMLHTQRFTGYAPGFPVASETDNGGDEWDIDVTLTGYTDAATVATWLTAGDLVRVVRPDSNASAVDGTVVSIVDSDTVRVQFGATWTPGADDWVLVPTLSPNHASGDPLARFCFVADTAYRLEYSDGDTEAQVLA